MAYGVKSVILSWGALKDATHCRVLKDPDGASGYGQSGLDQATTGYGDTPAVHLTESLDGRCEVSACNAAGNTDSNLVTSLDLLKAVGYFKTSNSGDGDEFGISLALSADGSTLAVYLY